MKKMLRKKDVELCDKPGGFHQLIGLAEARIKKNKSLMKAFMLKRGMPPWMWWCMYLAANKVLNVIGTQRGAMEPVKKLLGLNPNSAMVMKSTPGADCVVLTETLRDQPGGGAMNNKACIGTLMYYCVKHRAYVVYLHARNAIFYVTAIRIYPTNPLTKPRLGNGFPKRQEAAVFDRGRGEPPSDAAPATVTQAAPVTGTAGQAAEPAVAPAPAAPVVEAAVAGAVLGGAAAGAASAGPPRPDVTNPLYQPPSVQLPTKMGQEYRKPKSAAKAGVQEAWRAPMVEAEERIQTDGEAAEVARGNVAAVGGGVVPPQHLGGFPAAGQSHGPSLSDKQQREAENNWHQAELEQSAAAVAGRHRTRTLALTRAWRRLSLPVLRSASTRRM